MSTAVASGTEGYADEAKDLFERYEAVSAADAHRAVLHLLPTTPGTVLDIGSGTDRKSVV